jgi:ABC-2 type transport system ATP-binding protein
MTMLRVMDLQKKYGSFTAVAGVSFEIQPGEIFSLLGPNGAGKTTTISMLSCLLQPSGGEAWLDGHSILHETAAVKQRIGYVPQELALYESLTAMQNLTFWGRMAGLRGEGLQERSTAVLAQVGLTDRAQHRVSTFSGGMKRRLNIAIGLLHKPRLVFMDEPTVGIDPQSRRNILDMVLALRDEGMTVLYTTHYMEEAQELSDRVGIMDHGRMIACGTQKELTKQVGQQEMVKLHLAEQVDEAVMAAWVTAVQTLLHLSQLTSDEQTISLSVPNATEALPAILPLADQYGLRLRSIEIQEPNLETLFLHLTGRALRD